MSAMEKYANFVFFKIRNYLLFFVTIFGIRLICQSNCEVTAGEEIFSTSVVPSVSSNLSEVSSENSTDNTTVTPSTPPTSHEVTTPDFSYLEKCPDNAPCENLGAVCISCKINHYCTYGRTGKAECTVKPNITCQGNRNFSRPYFCRYSYQLDVAHVTCNMAAMTGQCSMKKAPPEMFIATCKVKDDVLCLGNKTFNKKFNCNWTSGYKWSTALALSVTLGGFGVDRFYLGLWRTGIGKLFSFGGLGVWTIVDVILIAVGYVGPHDSSLYIYPWN